MKDALLHLAGLLGIAIAIIHGWLGQTKVIFALSAKHAVTRRINLAVFHLSTVYWFAGGIVLLLAPLMNDDVRTAAVWAVVGMYTAGAAANLWATHARHFGAYLLVIVAFLAALGA